MSHNKFRPFSPQTLQLLSGWNILTRTRRVMSSILTWSLEFFLELSVVRFFPLSKYSAVLTYSFNNVTPSTQIFFT